MDKNIVIDGTEYKINLEKAIKDGYLQKAEKAEKRKVGQIYKSADFGELYIVANLGRGEAALIGLYGKGNRYMDPVEIRNTEDISDDEWAAMANEDFIFVAETFADI